MRVAHDRLFIDLPASADSLTVTAAGLDAQHNDQLTLELKRLDFGAALADPPFAASPAGAAAVATDSGGGGAGPSVTVSGGALQAGRWYAVLSNGNDVPVGVTIGAEVSFDSAGPAIHRGLWEPSSRPGLGQGYEYNWGGNDRALIWYTYDEAGQPAWYIAGSPAVDGGIWTSPLYRVTNDGLHQQLAPVGRVSVTNLAENDALFSFTLFGLAGTERMQPLSPLTCPQVSGSPASYTGLWYRGVDGLGGASVVVNASTQAQIHYRSTPPPAALADRAGSGRRRGAHRARTGHAPVQRFLRGLRRKQRVVRDHGHAAADFQQRDHGQLDTRLPVRTPAQRLGRAHRPHRQAHRHAGVPVGARLRGLGMS
jgi:hypothetical protein